jgi:feruloyl esterase
LPGLVVNTAEEVPASSGAELSYPAHCAIGGQLDARQGIDGKPYAIGFELRLPLENYSQRFFFQGGGGTDGVINPAYGDVINTAATNALTRGYAVASTDGGHATGAADVSFGLDPQARSDYGYNAVGRVTLAAKAIIREFYGRAPARSYFVGCSNGGRQALVAAARFAEEFAGIIAADPGLNLPQAALAQAWDTQQWMRAATPGQLPKDAFPQAALSALSAQLLDRCDSLDGLADGIVQDTESCQLAFDLERDMPTCAEPGAAACLSAAQKSALQNVFGGVRAANGASLYSPWPWDPGLGGANWRFWKLDAGFAPLPFNTVIGAGALGYVFTTPPDHPDLSDGGLAYQLGFDFGSGAAKIFATDATFPESAMDFMTPPNPTKLTAFKARGGKLIVVHGSADPVFSAMDTVRWYRALLAADPEAASYAKLFLVPGMNHCSGGPATDRFDMLSALERWVEADVAPDSVVATVNPDNPDVAAQGWPSTRSRPLCAYPTHAVPTPGASDLESASSFSCR